MVSLPKTSATRQFAGCVLARVRPDQLASLKQLLQQIGAETTRAMQSLPVTTPLVPFTRLRTVHYARFALLEHDQQTGPQLAFSTNYDGPEGEDDCSESRAFKLHVEELVTEAGAGLERVFAHCEGFRSGKLSEFIKSRQRPASTFYVGSSGRSRDQILFEATLRRRVESILDAGNFRKAEPEVVRTEVLARLKPDFPEIPRFPAQPDLTGRVKLARYVLGGLVLVLGALIVATTGLYGITATLLIVLGLAFYFRHLELTDPQFQPSYSERTVKDFSVASAEENVFLQNQLTHVVALKPGTLRWVLIRLVFTALQFLARNQYNRGKLGDIPSIHFARWVLLPNRNVLFFSNFDSSWQSYLGDFIDQASNGLTAVWSNTVGYPRTTWLLNAGSRDAARFLAWTRHGQLPTQVWYSAYPGLSIVNINANTEIRRGLADPASMDAATWLFHLRNVDRVAADQLYSEERTREPPLPMADIQGIILWGYGHVPETRFLMLRVARRSPQLLAWLSALPLASAAAESKTDEPPEPLINLAFTHEGLRALGVDETLCSRFSTPFVQGSANEYRARTNGDVADDAPSQWAWGGPSNPVHVLLLIYAKTKTSVQSYTEEFLAQAQNAGLELVQNLEGTTLADRKEHFGFRDGIGQPTVEGSGRAESPGNTLPAGEFLLGHRDGYGNVSHAPISSAGFAFGMNGSYLVFRQLEQDVHGFWRYCSAQIGADAVTLASKMVGRWPSGAPLVRHPDKDPGKRFQDEDNFGYLSNDEDNDRYGARCPFGAHLRRTNPRDWQLGATPDASRTLANLHRILRRGRPYGSPVEPAMDAAKLIERALLPAPETDAPRGLQFLAFNANLERQFEFVQQQWLNNPKFAGQNSETDPLLGMRQTERELGIDEASFTLQTDVKTGICPSATALPRFVRVVGSAYFFMPSIPAVRLMSEALCRISPADALEQIPPDEQLYIDQLLDALREKMKEDYAGKRTLRDAHPKMHGCVRALFKVEPGLDESLRVGVFREAKTYQAFVRFSNAAGTPTKDSARDVRGAAIKLLGVAGAKLLEGAEDCSTHDFLTVSAPEFVTADVQQFSALVEVVLRGKFQRLSYLLRHPRIALQVLRTLGQHDSVLDIQYHSMVPYLFGDRAVKYSLRPNKAQSFPGPQRSHRDYLREDLKLRLSQSHASFDFLIQAQTDTREMPIEDATKHWSEGRSPFRKVATLEIPEQDFDTPERQLFGENLSFNPWRCLPEHRPLGGISRARRQIYRALSSFRHDRNTAVNREPSSW